MVIMWICGADSGKGMDDDGIEDETLVKNENGDRQTWNTVPGEYKMPLVWIDLEMTGEV